MIRQPGSAGAPAYWALAASPRPTQDGCSVPIHVATATSQFTGRPWRTSVVAAAVKSRSAVERRCGPKPAALRASIQAATIRCTWASSAAVSPLSPNRAGAVLGSAVPSGALRADATRLLGPPCVPVFFRVFTAGCAAHGPEAERTGSEDGVGVLEAPPDSTSGARVLEAPGGLEAPPGASGPAGRFTPLSARGVRGGAGVSGGRSSAVSGPSPRSARSAFTVASCSGLKKEKGIRMSYTFGRSGLGMRKAARWSPSRMMPRASSRFSRRVTVDLSHRAAVASEFRDG